MNYEDKDVGIDYLYTLMEIMSWYNLIYMPPKQTYNIASFISMLCLGIVDYHHIPLISNILLPQA